MSTAATSGRAGKSAILFLVALTIGACLSLGAGKTYAGDHVDPVAPEFNYLGLTVATLASDYQGELVHTPADGEPIVFPGFYTGPDGNFKVPMEDGVKFPPFSLDMELFKIDGQLELADDVTGRYDSGTGKMTMKFDLSLTLGTDNLEALGEKLDVQLGTGELRCQLSPLKVSASTEESWPAPGKNFVDKSNWIDGAIAGNWRGKPAATAVIGDQSVCNIIRGLLKPVGGIWLVNDPTESITAMPQECGVLIPLSSGSNCFPGCPDGQVVIDGECGEPKCPPGHYGTPPNCFRMWGCSFSKTGDSPKPNCSLAPIGLTLSKKKTKVKRGSVVTLKLEVKNPRANAGTALVKVKSNNRHVRVPRTLQLKVGARSTVTRNLRVRIGKRAKGKARITVKLGKRTARTVLRIRK